MNAANATKLVALPSVANDENAAVNSKHKIAGQEISGKRESSLTGNVRNSTKLIF